MVCLEDEKGPSLRALGKSNCHLRGVQRHFWQSRILTRSVVLTGNQDVLTVAQIGDKMKLRNIQGDYNIGLDLGTGSVGWAVTSIDGELLTQNDKPAWGSRVFPSGETAADTRLKRGQRRRYERRRWRLDLLQRFFEDDMAVVDPAFFIRLTQARLLREDRDELCRDYHSPLFISGDAERDYYKRFPTIYHLRAWLMTTEKKADLREVYLALHNIVKHRGNFLYQDNPGLSATAANMEESIEKLSDVLEDRCAELGISCSCDVAAIREVLEDTSSNRSDKHKAIEKLFGFDNESQKTFGKHISKAIVGLKADFSSALGVEFEDSAFELSNDEKVEAALSAIPDDVANLFEAIRLVYSAYVLSGILNSDNDEPITSGALACAQGRTISFCKVREYEQYKQDLVLLKQLIREYAPAEYDAFFRGEVIAGTNLYDPSKAKGYTRYNLTHKVAYADFSKEVKTLLDKTAAVTDERYKDMLKRFEEEHFLRRLKTSDNGSIPYQLHLEEMDAILKNQGRHYPFLLEQLKRIESLVSFRIPYYVGPLTQKNAARDKQGEFRFSWATRRPGMENEPVFPWNWEEVIDKEHAAHAFIQRMTGDCAYLVGEDVLPRHSLLYEEFCVLNELNGAQYSIDGDDWRRFDYADRMGILEDLFKQRGSVTYKMVADWMRANRGWAHVHVRGGQGEAKFESSMPAYRFFCKDVFKVDELTETMLPMVETIILWSTLFEDRSILKEQLDRNFSDRLSAAQIKAICKKRLTGWGKLSEKFLAGVKAHTDDGPRSIMDILREGSPTGGEQGRAMVLMEVLHDERLGFEKMVEEINAEKLAAAGRLEVEDLPGSPALRRTVNQAVRIVEEIVRIAGKAPTAIFIENTRDEDASRKGKRTKRRYDAVKEAVDAFKRENADLAREFKGFKAPDFDNERLVLYFMQGGKSLYSGAPLEVSKLSTYEVDHILPQSYIKDDSLENKALVLKSENQTKTNQLLIPQNVRVKMASYWQELNRCGLIGDKKLRNLMCSDIGERRIKGFIARQLVETSQIVKLTKMVLENRLSDARVLPIKASLSHELRETKRFYKCREINDFHHAHDALLAAEIGRFLLLRHPGIYENPIGYAHVVKDFVRSQAEDAKKTGRMPGSAGFVISSFLRSGFDKETGEVFKDSWDAEFECERIRKYLNYRQVYLSRMPYIDSGKFWAAQPVPASTAPGIPLKTGLDPKKYGGYQTKEAAFFFVGRYRDARGRQSLRIAKYPVCLLAALQADPDAMVEVARQFGIGKKLELEAIVRPCIMQDQLVEISGSRLWVTGEEEMKAAGQLALSQSETKVFLDLRDSRGDVDELARAMYVTIRDRVEVAGCPLLAADLKLRERESDFGELNPEEKRDVVLNLMQLTLGSRQSRAADLSKLGGKKGAGRLRPARATVPSGFAVIDQSVTGMFERKTYIGL